MVLLHYIGKVYTIEENLILSAVKDVTQSVLHKPTADIFLTILLDINSSHGQILEMAENIEDLSEV